MMVECPCQEIRTIVRLASLLILASLAAGCLGLPSTSRSGKSHDILILEDRITPLDLKTGVGDEVRWVNRRPRPVWVYFMREDFEEISCSRGFSLSWATEEGARIDPGQSVAVCFGKPDDEVSYDVQDAPIVIRGSTAGEGGSFERPTALHGAIIVEEAASPGGHGR